MSSNYQYAPDRIGPLVAKIQTGRLDLEMGYPAILWVILLATGYVIISGSTMTKFKECEEAKKSGHYKSLESLLSHTMTIAITIPVAFLLGQYFNKDATLWTLFYGVMGLIGSVVALDIARKCKKEGKTRRPRKQSRRSEWRCMGAQCSSPDSCYSEHERLS